MSPDLEGVLEEEDGEVAGVEHVEERALLARHVRSERLACRSKC